MSGGSALFLKGTQRINGGNEAVFDDGLRCAGGSIVRSALESGLGSSTSGWVATSGRRVYQTWYRNAAAFCTPSTFNLTNAVEIVWSP